jgi:hypothetical protein
MNLFLKILEWQVPTFIKKKKLEELFACTAAALECDAPSLRGLAYDECLREYALFTKRAVKESIEQGRDLRMVKDRLYQNAYQIGEELAKTFHITTMEDVMRMGRILYRTLAIDFRGTAQGEVTITQCYFSKFYSPQICQVISALDAGVFAGMSGGARLTFTQRITESSDRCRACLSLRTCRCDSENIGRSYSKKGVHQP